MAKQLTFYLTHSDVLDFIQDVFVLLDLLVLGEDAVNGGPDILSFSDAKFDGGSNYYIVRRVDVASVCFSSLRSGRLVVDDLRSPVVVLEAGFMGEGVLRFGRLFCHTSYFGTEGELIKKQQDFIKFVEKIFRHLKSRCNRVEAGYVSDQVLEMVKSGEVRLSKGY